MSRIKFSLLTRVLAALAVGALSALPLGAYDLIRGPDGARITWNDGTIPLVIRAAATPVYQDGTGPAASLQAAATAWNGQLARVQFSTQSPGVGFAGSANGLNEMSFEPSIYSAESAPESFGPNTLAVTISYRSQSPRGDGTYQRTESDIIFNSGLNWSSYRGALQSAEDIRRVAIHELGHLLGLDHPNQNGQSVTAIMNSTVSHVDSLQTDDITGAQLLYGRPGGFSRPANDNFAQAAVLTLTGSINSLNASSIGATRESGEPDHVAGERGGASVWWKWTATQTGYIYASTPGSKFDTMMAAYSGSSLATLQQLASNDDSPTANNRTSALNFFAIAGNTYYLAVDGWDGEWGELTLVYSFTAQAGSAPTVTIHQSTAADEGWIQYSANLGGVPEPTVRWQLRRAGATEWTELVDGTFFAGTTSKQVRIAETSDYLGAELRCVATNPFGSVTSSAAVLDFYQWPSATLWRDKTIPASVFTGAPMVATITVVNIGTEAWGPDHRITLSPPGKSPIASVSVAGIAPGGSTQVTLPFTAPFTPGSYTYHARLVWAGAEWMISLPLPFNATAEDVPPGIVIPPQSQTVYAGDDVTLSVTAVGQTPLTYQWLKDGVEISGQTQSTLSLPNIQPDAAGAYRVRVTNARGTTLSTFAHLTVQVAPAPVQLAAGYVSIFLRGDLSRWGIGRDYSGGIGSGVWQVFSRPGVVDQDVALVAAGEGWQAHVRSDGTLWTSGEGSSGSLGHGNNSSLTASTKVAGVSDVVALSAVGRTLHFIKADGTLWGNGPGASGNSPTLIATDVQAVSCGRSTTLFLKFDGSVWGMGQSNEGQLGSGPEIHWNWTVLPVKIAEGAIAVSASYNASLYLKADGTLMRVGTTHTVVAENVTRLFTGQWNYAFLKSDGTLWGAGANQYGQLGLGHTNSPSSPALIASGVVAAALGAEHSLFLKTDGSLWGMGAATGGSNNGRALGSQYSGNLTQPVQLAIGTIAIPPAPTGLVASAEVYVGGVHLRWNATPRAVGYEIWREPAAGGAAVLVSTVYSQLAFVDATPGAATPSLYRVAAINPAGRGAMSESVQAAAVPTALPAITAQPADVSVRHLAGTQYFSFEVVATGVPRPSYRWQRLESGVWQDINVSDFPSARTARLEYYWHGYDVRFHGTKFRCVVTNHVGSVASAPATASILVDPPVIYSYPSEVVMILGEPAHVPVTYSGGAIHTTEWLKNGVVIGTGVFPNNAAAQPSHDGTYVLRVINSAGVVETGPIVVRTVPAPAVTHIAAGSTHSLYITSDGALWGMGRNEFGQIGAGGETRFRRIVAPSAVHAAAGDGFSVWVDRDGNVWGLGSNEYGQLGLTAPASSTTPLYLTDQAIAVAAGFGHVLILKRDGSLWGMGYNGAGQLGVAPVLRSPLVRIAGRVRAMTASYLTSFYLDFNDQLWGMGSNPFGGLGFDTSGQNVTTPRVVDGNVARVSAGSSYTLFVKNNGTVWGMGRNEYGQLGSQIALYAHTAAPLQLATNAQNAWAHETHSVVLLGDGTLRTMGSNRRGQLGVAGDSRTEWTLAIGGMTAADAGAEHTLALDTNGHLWGFGRNENHELSLNNLAAWTSMPTKLFGTALSSTPGNPTRISADGTLGDGILLTWDAQPGATYYEVWRSTSPDFHDSVLHASSLQHPLFADLWSSPGVDYYYRIRSRSTAPAAGFDSAVKGRHGAVFASPALATQPLSQSVDARSNVTLGTDAGGAEASYQWRHNGVALTGATNATLQLADIGDDQAGSYTVVVTTPSGTVVSAAALVEVAKLSQTIEDFALAAQTALAREPLIARASSDLPVQFEVIAGQGFIEDGMLHLSTGATVTVRASQVGNRHYLPATPVTRTVTRTASASQAWREAHFNPEEMQDAALGAWTADPDGDGLSNLLEYALARDPWQTESAEIAVVAASGDELTFVYERPADRSELSYEVEVSTDLQHWTTQGVTHELSATRGDRVEWRATHPRTTAPLFFRLKVTSP